MRLCWSPSAENRRSTAPKLLRRTNTWKVSLTAFFLPAGTRVQVISLRTSADSMKPPAARSSLRFIYALLADFGVHLPAPERWMVAWVATSVLLAKSKGKSLT